MATHLDLDEQEQLDDLKHFWKRWGNLITWLLIGILSSYAGWMGWQAWQSKQSAQSAALFDTVERAAVAGDLVLFERSVGDIKSKFASTTYAHQAAFLASRIFQEKSRPKEAREQLQWVIDQASDEGYQALARLRLSSLLIQDKEFDAARKLLSAKSPESFEPLVADRLGDLDMLTNQTAEAIKHYQSAWKAMEPNAQYRRLIAFKLAALGADPEAGANVSATKPTQESYQVKAEVKAGVTMRFGHLICLGTLAAVLAACSASRPKPVDIPPVAVLQEARTAWTAQIGKVNFPLSVATRDDRIALANSDGTVAMLNAKTGKDIWRFTLPKTTVSAGVGSDGQQVALVTRDNQLVVMQDAKVQWRQTLPAQSFTPPLVAGQRIFVLTADRSVLAYDGATGQKLWTQQRPGEPLVLKQAGVLVAFKNTLLVGLSGRLAGLDPTNGVIVWESAIATPRGTNDMERLVDLIGPTDRVGDVVCARAFQAQVGCIDAQKGQSLWTRPSVGDKGLSGNANLVIAPLANGVVQAWRREDGERVWETERLKYRLLSAPLVTPKGVVIADSGGFVYVLSLGDGALLNRLKMDGEELAAAPAVASNVYVLVSREGRVTGLNLP